MNAYTTAIQKLQDLNKLATDNKMYELQSICMTVMAAIHSDTLPMLSQEIQKFVDQKMMPLLYEKLSKP